MSAGRTLTLSDGATVVTHSAGRPFHETPSSDHRVCLNWPDSEPLRRWPSDDREQLLIRSDEAAVEGGEAEPVPGGSVLEKLLAQWADAAVSHAVVRSIDDPAGLVAAVAGIDGAWGFGSSPEEALDDLKSVLIDWAALKLADGDDDIPSMEGVHLAVDRCPEGRRRSRDNLN